MPYNAKQIKPLTSEKGKTLVKVGNQRSVDNKIVFSFSFFNGHSISINDFNNFYANNSDAIKAVSDFFQTLKDISNFEIKQFFSPAIKTQFHYNEFDKEELLEMIIDSARNGDYTNIADFVKDYDDLFTCV